MEIEIPEWLVPKKTDKVIRLGRENDGGYIVCEADVFSADGLLSFGINDDWSFEKSFRAINKVPIHAYDASVNKKFFAKLFFKYMRRNIFDIYVWFKKVLDYSLFFRGPVKHQKNT